MPATEIVGLCRKFSSSRFPFALLIIRDHMPQKCRLTIHSNRVHIQNVFAAARESLKRLDSTLYHYARAGHPMRAAATELKRRFDALDRELADKVQKKERYL
jgi:hypothetical protein